MSRHERHWIDSFLEYTDNTEPDAILRKWVAIGTIASCLQRKCWIQWDNKTFPNFYIVLVAPPGMRKGSAMDPARYMLHDIGIKMAPQSVTREQFIREMKNSIVTNTNDETGEMEYHCSLTVFSKELAVFLGYGNNQFMSDLCDIFDCDELPWTYATKHQGTDEVDGSFLNIIGGITPELMKLVLPAGSGVGGGLTSRMILVYTNKKGKVVPYPFLTEFDPKLKDHLRKDLEQIHLLRGPFKVTRNFLILWKDWYEGSERNPPFEDTMLKGYAERRAKHALKLGMILSASRTDDMVMGEGDLTRAIALLEEVEVRMPFVFAGYGRLDTSEIMRRIGQFILRTGRVSLGKILAHFMTEVTKRELMDMIESFRISGMVVVTWEDRTMYISPRKGEEDEKSE